MTMKRIGIFGTSGMAREVGDIAWSLGYSPIYVAHNQNDLNTWTFSDEVIIEADILSYRDISFVIGIGDNKTRQKIAQRYCDQIKFCNLIDMSASFGKGQRQVVEAKRGIIVCAGVRFTNNIQVGDFCIFNLNSTISHDVVIEEFVYVAPGAHIAGNVYIGARSWVGAGAVINQGNIDQKLIIANDTVIGSGAVVVKDCEPNAVYAGIPARKIK